MSAPTRETATGPWALAAKKGNSMEKVDAKAQR
jgi:hypothetical protein